MEKKFTWSDLKRIANRIPKDRLKDEVIIWTDRDDDAAAFKVNGVQRLEEDYIFDQDDGCAPKSVMKELIADEKAAGTYDPDEYYLIHPKGRRILYAE